MESKLVFVDRKKGQVGETVTWVVATVIILVILFVSIFFASDYFDLDNKNVESNKADYLVTSSLSSYLLTKNPEQIMIYNQIKQESELNDFNGPLALNVFRELYDAQNFFEDGELGPRPFGTYLQVWFGVVPFDSLNPYVSNDYFGTSASFSSRKERVSYSNIPSESYERILLNHEKNIIELQLQIK